MSITRVFANDVRKSTKLQRRFAKLMMSAIGLAFGSIVAEVALRIADYSYPIWYQNDPQRGRLRQRQSARGICRAGHAFAGELMAAKLAEIVSN